MTGIHALVALWALGAALDAGLPADALGELYGAADAAVEELESERGPEDEGAAWLRAELRRLEEKMPRDVSALQAILARAPVGSRFGTAWPSSACRCRRSASLTRASASMLLRSSLAA